MLLSVAEIAAVTAADPTGLSAAELAFELRRAVVDSREAREGDLFACLPGERADGHDFAAQAVEKGAGAVLAARPLPHVAVPVLVVRDVLAALGALARAWRLSRRPRVIAVTGSAGKTTLKEMLATTLSTRFTVAKNHKNFNNQLGLPLSILGTSGEEDYWVMELGISRPGDMEELGAIALPDVAVIHNIGPAHLEGLGDLKGVARAKAALVGFVREGGTAVINRCHPDLWEAACAHGVPLVALSTSEDVAGDVVCLWRGPAGPGQGRFELSVMGEAIACELPYPGAHFAENVGAVFAVAALAGFSPEETARTLTRAVAVEGRFCCREIGESILIDDTYNANPLSMRRAIACAEGMAAGRPLVLVLGDMLELGESAAEAHRDLGRFIANTSVRAVFWRGERAGDVHRGLGGESWRGLFAAVRRPEDFAAAWAGFSAREGCAGVVLVKGSRSCRMEEFCALLENGLRAGEGES